MKQPAYYEQPCSGVLPLVCNRAMQSAGLDGQKPGGPGFLPPDRFERTGRQKLVWQKKAGPANGKPARRKKAGPAKKRAGFFLPAREIPARQIRAGRVWNRAALLVLTGPSRVIWVSTDLEARASDQECRPSDTEVRAQLEWGLQSARSCPATTGVDRMGGTDVDVGWGGEIGLRLHR